MFNLRLFVCFLFVLQIINIILFYKVDRDLAKRIAPPSNSQSRARLFLASPRLTRARAESHSFALAGVSSALCALKRVGSRATTLVSFEQLRTQVVLLLLPPTKVVKTASRFLFIFFNSLFNTLLLRFREVLLKVAPPAVTTV